MNVENAAIVRAALEAKTAEEAMDLQGMIAMSFGEEYFRPLGDRWGNFGLLASAADYDLKLVELITNMQDAVIERAALAKFGSREEASRALKSPREASLKLFKAPGHEPLPEVAFWESDPPASQTHKLTVWFDDRGTGMTNESVSETIFALGGSNKEDAPYLQGAFGLGGELMYRNSPYVVLVTRRAPELLQPDEDDRITVAVVQWNDQTKTKTAAYLVDREWNRPGEIALPWSCAASDYPDFAPGTHLALISYGTAGLYRKREGDERSFDTIVNTRLFRPILNSRWRNYLARGDSRATVLSGLRTHLDNTSHNFPVGSEQLPFVYAGKQYFLETSYAVFAERGQSGERRSFVAHDHAVLFTSNGQVQTHWKPSEFKQKTKLKKLDSRVLVEVDLDSLPVEARTALVTPDRAETVKSDVARKLDEAVASFLNDWESLVDENQAILQEQLRSTTQVNTRGVSDQIRRAFSARGFGGASNGIGMGGPGDGASSGGSPRPQKPKVPKQLLDDPTELTGPKTLQLEIGRTRGQYFEINATDDFFARGRGELTLEAGEGFPFESVSEIVVIGRPHGGRVRLGFAIPEGYEESSFDVSLILRGWTKASGGLGPDLTHTINVALVKELPGAGTGDGRKPTGASKGADAGRGANAVLLWVSGSEREWQPTHVGDLERIPASVISKAREEYVDLSSLGETEIDCITLNADFHPLVKYLDARAEAITSTDTLKNRYAVGVGVQMLVLANEEDRMSKTGYVLDDQAKSAAQRSAARGVLAVLPEFDRLARIIDDEE